MQVPLQRQKNDAILSGARLSWRSPLWDTKKVTLLVEKVYVCTQKKMQVSLINRDVKSTDSISLAYYFVNGFEDQLCLV